MHSESLSQSPSDNPHGWALEQHDPQVPVPPHPEKEPECKQTTGIYILPLSAKGYFQS